MICKTCKLPFEPIKTYSGLNQSKNCNSCRVKAEILKRKIANLQRSNESKKSPEIALKLISLKQKFKNDELAKIKKQLPSICIIPGCQNKGIDLCHILAKSLYPEYYTKKENLVRMCRIHHNLFDDCKEFRQKQVFLYNQVADFDLIAATKYFDYADNLRTNSE